MLHILHAPHATGQYDVAVEKSEIYRQLAPLGATHMTGGGDDFYKVIGFEPKVQWKFWEKA